MCDIPSCCDDISLEPCPFVLIFTLSIFFLIWDKNLFVAIRFVVDILCSEQKRYDQSVILVLNSVLCFDQT